MVGYRTDLVYREGDRRQWLLAESYIDVHYSTYALGSSWNLNALHRIPSGDVRWGYYGSPESAPSVTEDSEGGRFSGRTRFREQSSEATLTVQTLRGLIIATTRVRIEENSRTETSTSVRIRPSGKVAAGFTCSRYHLLPSYTELYFDPYSDDGPIGPEGGNLYWEAPIRSTELEVLLNPFVGVQLDLQLQSAKLEPEKPSYGDVPMDTYTGELYGELATKKVTVRRVSKSELTSAVEFSEIDLDFDSLTAHNGGLKFAYFGVIDVHAYRWKYSIAGHSWHAGLHFGHASGELKGVIQAWPFLRGLNRFLGERRHVVLSGKLDWLYATTGASVWNSGCFSLSGTIDYLRIEPDVHYSTWRPLFLGMGMDDLRTGPVTDIAHANLMRLRLNPCLTWHRFSCQLDVSQWIPIAVKRRGSPVSPHSAYSGENQHIWGGFSASVVVKLTM